MNGGVVISESPEVFRGHLDECVEHLSRCLHSRFPKGTNGARRALEPIAKFCGADTQTVACWLRESGAKTIGEKRIRLICFLDMVGYRVLEVESLGYPRKDMLKVIAFNVLTVRETAMACGYAGEQSLYRLFFSNSGVNLQSHQKMCQLLATRKCELAQKVAEAKTEFRLEFSLAEEFLTRETSSVMCIVAGLLGLLEVKGVGDTFVKSLNHLPLVEKKAVLKLSDMLHEFSVIIARGSERE